MTFSIGEVAKIFNLSTETIKYYEKEGLLSPQKNESNNYRVFSDHDLTRLYDILFYRSVSIPIGEIRKILKGEDMKKVAELIDRTENKLIEQRDYYNKLLSRLQKWKILHNEDSIKYLNQFEIRKMPAAYRSSNDYFNYTDYTIHYMKEFKTRDEVNYNSTSAFSCITTDNNITDFKKYIILEEENLPSLSSNEKFSIEYSEKCLYTVAEFNADLKTMLNPMIKYASNNSIKLKGQIYGRLCYINHTKQSNKEFYRLYGVIDD